MTKRVVDEEGNLPEGLDTYVEEFLKTFGASLDPRLWVKLVEEELAEAKAETVGTEAHLKELADLSYVFVGFSVVSGEGWDSLEFLPKEEKLKTERLLLEATNYLWDNGKLIEGELNEAFYRVHMSNMSKLGDDGKPIYREDGKVLKGPNYKSPDLSDLV